IWLKNIERDFAAFNEVWVQWMPEGYSPARAAVQAEMARPEILVEIMLTAVKA
ncbi:RidA family protein, partial [Klebsiella pneumoniae]